MTIKTKRYFLTAAFLFLLVLPFVVVLSATSQFFSSESALIVLNVFQRISGLMALTLIFTQIIPGAFLSKWVQIIGSKAYKFHITLGLLSYGFILIHPFLNSLLTLQITGSFGAVLADIFVGAKSQHDLLQIYGKFALILLTIGVGAGYFRTKLFFRKNWKVFHIVNYLAFILVAIHSKGLGSDINSFPYSYLYWIFVFFVFLTLVYKLIHVVRGYLHKASGLGKSKIENIN